MKNTFLLLIIVITSTLFTSCNSQAENILLKSYDKCQSIKNGYYEMDKYIISTDNTDIIKSSYTCYFQRLVNDTIFFSAFHYKEYKNSEFDNGVLYTGNEIVEYWSHHNMGDFITKNNINPYHYIAKLYGPFININNPIPDKKNIKSDKNTYDLIGKETMNGIPCYHIRRKTNFDNDNNSGLIRLEINYWIKIEDFIPVEYTVDYDIKEDNNIINKYERIILTKYELNNLQDNNQLTLSSIPSNINISEYNPN